MPKVKFDKVISFSTEDSVHVAANILNPDPAKKWKCRSPGEKSCSIVLQLEKACVISGIDIGNEHSAYIEVLVSRSGGDEDFKGLLVMSSFMTPLECRQGQNVNKVRMFKTADLVKPECEQKWDRVKIICTQPFNKHIQYGLSFVTLHSSESQVVNSTGPVHIGKFTLRPESPKDFSTGSLFARRKELSNKAPQSPAAAIRDASLNPSSFSRVKTPITKKTTPKRKNVIEDDDDDDENPKPIKNRNRNELLYNDDDEKSNDKIDRLIEKKKKEDEDKKAQQLKEEESKKKQKAKKEEEKRKKTHESKYDTPKKDEDKRRKDETPKKRDEDKQKTPTKVMTAAEKKSYDTPETKKAKKSPSSSSSSSSSKRKTDDKTDDKSPQKKRKSEDVQSSNKRIKQTKKTKPFGKLMEGATIVISGIQNPERSNLRTMALAMGARYKTDWDNSCTHLICAFQNTPKFNQVKGKGKIITKHWILESHKKRKRLPWRRFSLDPSDLAFSESEEEICEQIDEQPSVVENGSDTDEEVNRIQQQSESQKRSEQQNDSQKQSTSQNQDGVDTDDEIQRIQNQNDVSPSHAVDSDEGIKNNDKKNVEDIVLSDDCDDSHDRKKNGDESINGVDISNEKAFLSSLPKLPKFFDNKTFHVDLAFDNDVRKKLIQYIIAYKGKVIDDILDDTNYIITQETNVFNIKEVSADDAKLLAPDWIWECHNNKKLMPIENFLYT